MSRTLYASEKAAMRQLSDDSLRAIIARGSEPEAVTAEDVLLDRAAEAAREEASGVKAELPTDPDAHPMSGRVGEY